MLKPENSMGRKTRAKDAFPLLLEVYGRTKNMALVDVPIIPTQYVLVRSTGLAYTIWL